MMAHPSGSAETRQQLATLDSECQDLLRSGIAITSVAQCVEELVLNALDAGASCVAVRVDLPCGRIQCVDNGSGLTKEQLEKIANRYSTSKCKNLDDLVHNLGHYGYRGEALASIRSIAAVLEIQTRASTRTYVREFTDGKDKGVLDALVQRPSAGTTITVHDLFHRLPVRKKQLNVNLELELIRQRMEGIALIHPWIAFSLRNDDTNQLILKTSKSNSVAGTFTQLFTSSKGRGLCDVSNTLDEFEVKGYISKEGHHNKNLQYVYVNGRLVLKSKVHRVLNWMISRSSISRKRHEVVGIDGSPTRMTSERFGIYVVNVTCPLSQYDITFDPKKTLVEFKSWGTLLKCLEKAVGDFMIREGFKTEKMEFDGSPHLEKFLDDGEASEETKEQTDTQEESTSCTKYGTNISTWASINNKHSIAVRRPRQYSSIQDLVKENESVTDDYMKDASDNEILGRLHSEELFTQTTENDVNVSSSIQDTAPGVRDKTFLSLSGASDQPDGSYKFTSLSSRTSISLGYLSSSAENEPTSSVKLSMKDNSDYASSMKSEPPSQVYRSSLQKFKRNVKFSFGSQNEKMAQLSKEDVRTNFDVIKQRLKLKKARCEAAAKASRLPVSSVECVTNLTDRRDAGDIKIDSDESSAVSGKEMPIFRIPIDESDMLSSMPQFNEALPSTSTEYTHRWMRSIDTPLSDSNSTSDDSVSSSLPSFQAYQEFISDELYSGRKRRVGAPSTYASKLSKISGYEGRVKTQVPKTSREFLSTGSLVQTANDLGYTELSSSKQRRSNTGNEECSHTRRQTGMDGLINFYNSSPSSYEDRQLTSISDSRCYRKDSDESQSYSSVCSHNSGLPAFDEKLRSTESSADNVTLKTSSGNGGWKDLNSDSNKKVNGTGSAASVSSSSDRMAHANKEMTSMTKLNKDNNRYPGLPGKHESDKSSEKTEVSCHSSDSIVSDLEVDKRRNFVPIYLENPFRKRKSSGYGRTEDVPPKNVKKTSAANVEVDLEWRICPKVSNVLEAKVQRLGNASYMASAPKEAKQSVADGIRTEGPSSLLKLNESNRTHCSEHCDKMKNRQSVIDMTPPSDSESPVSKLIIAIESDDAGKLATINVPPSQQRLMDDSSSSQSSPALTVPTFTSPDRCETQRFNNFAEDFSQGFDLSGPCTQPFAVTCDKECDTDGYVKEKQCDKCDIYVSDHSQACLNDTVLTKSAINCDINSYETNVDTTGCDSSEAHALTSKESLVTHQSNVKEAADLEQDLVISSSSDDNCEKIEENVGVVAQAHKTSVTCTKDDKNSSGQLQNSTNYCTVIDTQTLDNGAPNQIINESSVGEASGGSTTPITGTEPVTVNTDMSEDLFSSAAADSERSEEQSVKDESQPALAETSGCDEVTDAELLGIDVVPSTSTGVTKPVPKKNSTTVFVGPSWICKIDPVSGDKVYVNRITGCSSLKNPLSSGEVGPAAVAKKSALSTSKTHKLLTDNAAVFLQQVEHERAHKQHQKDDQEDTESAEIQDLIDSHLENLDIESVAIKWRQGSVPHEYERSDAGNDGPPIMSAESVQTKSSQFESRLHYAIHPQKITKSMLNTMKVIGQADNKFIACLMQKEDQLGTSSDLNSWLLVVIDQHAAHERVRLEQLKDGIYEETEDSTLKSTQLNPALELTMLPEDVRLMTSYRKHLISLGIHFEGDPEDPTNIKLTTLPPCFIDEQTSQLKQGRMTITPSVIQIMLKKRLELLQTTGGVCATLPMEVHHLLCLEACHGAVKFGDAMSMKECRLLIENLHGCKLPFQCAHGRPSIMPLLDLQKLTSLSESDKVSKPLLKNLKLKMQEEKLLTSSNAE